MNCGNKLDFLIKTFSINNSKLARAINVDPSLISKWRNGSRPLTPSSTYIPLIADYFLNIASLQNQKNTLMKLLSRSAADSGEYNSSQIRQLFMDWFFSDEAAVDTASFLTNTKLQVDAEISNMLRKLSVFSKVSKDELVYDTNNSITIFPKSGETGAYELFRGAEGKRQAALNIINIILASSEPLELLLLDETNLDWLVQDKSFFMFFGNALKKLIYTGHKITIIHHVKRSASQLMNVVDFWLPMHMTGNIKSYYYPKYTEVGHKKTLCIIRGLVSAISLSTELEAENSSLLVFSNPIIGKLLEDLFMSYLAKCRPLLKTYTSTDMLEYNREICAMEEKLGASLYPCKWTDLSYNAL